MSAFKIPDAVIKAAVAGGWEPPVMASHWNSPETAPKDGTRILAIVDDESLEPGRTVDIVEWIESIGWRDGYYGRLEYDMGYVPIDIHGWMPLPEITP